MALPLYPPLHLAAVRGDGETIETLLLDGADIDVRSPDGTTAIMFAAMAGEHAVTHQLIQGGADVKIHRDGDGFTALHFAVNGETVEILSSSGADMDARTSDGKTALHTAALLGHGETVEILLSKGADKNARSTDGSTAIMYAIMKAGVVKTLVDAGADVNVRRDGITALILAVASGNHESIRILVEEGADSSIDDGGSTILHTLVSEEKVDVDTVKVLLDSGVDADIHRDHDGCTPAHLAAIQGQRETVVALLSSGADMNARSKTDLTPMMYSVMVDQHAVTQTLVDSGADVDARRSEIGTRAGNGRTALHLAALNGHHESARILLESGADSSICVHHDGKCILHRLMIALPIDVDMVNVLLDARADATAATLFGTTILHQLTMNETVNEDVMGLLLDAGADPLAQDVDGLTPEDYLQQGESHDGVRDLLRRCATWRRRRWVVMLRSRSERNMGAPAAHRASMITRAERKLIGTVEILVLMPKDIFNLVVGFL